MCDYQKMKGESNCCLKKERKRGVAVVPRNSLAREQPVAAGPRGCSWFPRLGRDLRADGARPQLGCSSHVAAVSRVIWTSGVIRGLVTLGALEVAAV